MGRNNKCNQGIRRRIHADVDRAISLFYAGNWIAAKKMLESARSGLNSAPWNGGEAWRKEHEYYRQANAVIERPCDCFYCSLSKAQQQKLRDSTTSKQEDLRTVYTDDESNYTGAYAEVAFGFRYNLSINHVRGFDGGRDFSIPCSKTPSGILTIDVKGTVYGPSIKDIGRSYFPWIPNWNFREDHIYVLLQVVERQHVLFRGFAFGNDVPTIQIQYEGAKKHFLRRPGPERSLQELDSLILDQPWIRR